ncbi:adhesion G-protein coupled receptor G6 isoform X3 [Salmo trutta]|uniref:adhesion G-protein coupled receptor G6 isoform X3 n=1 Tax=Salmo trutta TaxID=8032 RepID=UPI0011320296|nr:adhesion G-protein coupled receptor G6-like isoform X3 [Salmo trutta]
MESFIRGGWWRWKFRNVLPVALLWMSLQRQAVLSCSNSNCVVVLKDSQGAFTSPCYPQDYPSSQACKWTLQAPAGFIVQITFLDFELEEALGCIYDRIIVNTGNQDVKFCGLTANGLTLNSTGNVMEVSFNSDFSVQKKGFSVSYRQVAVALRNQKVTVSNGAGKVVQVSNSVTIPTLQQFTVCFEIAWPNQKSKETIFSYTRQEDSSGEEALSFGNNQNGVALVMSNETCLIDSILNASDFTSTMKQFCLTWASTTGKVTLYYNSNYRVKTCSNTIGRSVGAGGLFRLGSHSSFDGTIYNFRLWDYAMDMTQLVTLTCDAVGNVIDWDNSFWDIPSSLAQTDSALSCICFPHCIHLTTAAPSSGTSVPVYTSQTTSCASPGLGCPATLTSTSSSIVTTNMIATNSTTHALSATTSSDTTTSMPLTTSSSTVQTTTTTTTAATTNVPTLPSTTTATLTSTSSSIVTTNMIATNSTTHALSATTSSDTTTSMPLTTSSSTVQTTTTTTTAATTNVPTLPSTTTATLTSTSSSIVTTNMIATNSTTHALSATTSSDTTTSMPLTTSSSTVQTTTTTTTAATTNVPTLPSTTTATLTSTSSSIVTTNMIATNSTTHALSATTSSDTTTSMPLTTSSSTVQTTTTTTTAATTNVPTLPSTTTVTQTIIPSAAAATNTTLFYSTTNALTVSATTIVSNPATTNLPTTNNTAREGLFYRISFVVNDKEAKLTESDVEKTVAQWLNQTFQNWTHVVYVDNFSIQPKSERRSASKQYTCQALLVYQTSTNVTLGEVAISTRVVGSSANIGNGLELESVAVQSVENCPEETPLHYIWPESRPTVTQYVPCFPNKDQNTSRTCVISPLNYTAFWGAPDLSNCTDIDSINVSAENAAEVADQLADITNNELSTDEVSKVVDKVKELVNVAKINTTLATTVLNIISNVMTSSVSALAVASERTLKTVDELVQKLEFDGPSVSITSKNLALGISTLNHGKFNGTSFSAFIQPNTTDLQIDFESNQLNPLAQVTLPATLLKNLTDAETAAISRINFMFFSKIGLFQDKQDGLSLNSYVVASSVGNYTISNLQDPVEIEILHLNYQPKPKPTCMFWDFTMKNGSGGWNSKGCRVSPMSNGNKTICLCDHLTHFGILMDISGSAAQIDEKNTKILTFITYIGCGISAIFSAVTLLTYIAFEKLRRDYPSKILMNLSTSLLFLNMVFLLDGWLASFEMEGLCVAVAVFLHFFLLTSFTWMGLESIHMYIALVKVFNTYIRRYILKFCIVGWGLPAAIVATVVAIDKNSYGKMEYGKGETGQGSSEFCWIRSHVVFYVTCVGYFCVIFLLNVAMFIVVMIQICGRNGKRSNRTLREEVLRNLRSVISLTFLLGMTWGFAFFAWGPVNLAFMYLFSIFNSLQGLFIFIFHCALKENVQKQWRRYLCCGRFRLADNSDWSKTATNNTKKVSSDTVGKSLSSSSFGSSTANWTSKAKATLNPFAKRNSNAGKGYSNQTNLKSVSSDGEASSSSSSIIPVHQVIDKVKGYCSARSDNFYKNIIMSDSFSHSTKF